MLSACQERTKMVRLCRVVAARLAAFHNILASRISVPEAGLGRDQLLLEISIMTGALDRRSFIKTAAAAGAAIGFGASLRNSLVAAEEGEPLFKISLAEWSLHRTIGDGKLDNLDFPAFAKNEFGIDAVEYVSVFFRDKAK